ncbi:RNA polymerase sigma factor [Paenibacillus psychroresistens]|uniref:RNA polymerase sigma factor n=1 Tax=Paenibacillus psychroresistens TaxID=1778678 RepID=A0A6B8RVG7_9BACL|nr:RNA polymerase sigma factor [Paenibacillus psychroresistens]QGQ99276.1 RNA polymerase sigma factor [Paenibacillus psychroresistens]
MSITSLDLQQMQQQIYRYSLQITANQWEAEDLTQEVLLKLVRAMEIDPSRIITKAYLYRIASNAWKDKLKKDKGHLEIGDASLLHIEGEDGGLSTRELLEVLAHRLSPRAMVILLLMDVFEFTAKETAKFLLAAEGAIQVSLGRARLRLRKLAQQRSMGLETEGTKIQGDHEEQIDLNSLVDAFRRRDTKAICNAYLGLVKQHIKISKLIWINGKLIFFIEDPDGNKFRITE